MRKLRMSSVTRFAVRDIATGRFFAEPDSLVYTTNLWEVKYFKERPPVCEGQEVVLVDVIHKIQPYEVA